MKNGIRIAMAVITVLFCIVTIIGVEHVADTVPMAYSTFAAGAVQLMALFVACFAVFGVTK